MKIQIRGLHTTLTPAFEAYVEKRLSTLSKFVKDDVLCEVELAKTTEHHRQGDIFKAEATIDVEKDQVYAVSEKPDLYQAVDELRDELERILSSRKEKKITLFRRGSQKIKDMLKGIQPIESFKKWRG